MENKKKYEQFYTLPQIVDDLIDELKENVNIDEITEFQENSAGDGIMKNMNLNKGITKSGDYNDYFRLIYLRKSKYNLNDFIDKFNFDEYYCFKSSRVCKTRSTIYS